MWFLGLGDDLKEAAIDVLRKISFWVSSMIYPLIPKLYGIAEALGKHQFFTAEQISSVSRNIYTFVCVLMLFSMGIRLISAIVNPELLSDNKKGFKRSFFNSLIAVLLIIFVPIGFDRAYRVQNYLIESELVPRVILGADLDSTSSSSPMGQILAGYTLQSFFDVNDKLKDENSNVAPNGDSGLRLYSTVIRDDISRIDELSDSINDKNSDDSYTFEYNGIFAPLAGGFTVYELVLICMDLALRGLKLGLLQLIAPIVICGYIIKGSELLSKWFKEVLSTYLLVFIKIAALIFMIYSLSFLESFLDVGDFSYGKGIVTIFIIIGLFQLIKQIPNIINTIFGTNIKDSGGIKGRLGEMAAVGGLAQRAWSQVTQHPLMTARRAVSAPLSLAGGTISHAGHSIATAINRGRARAQELREARQGHARLRGFLTGLGSGTSGVLTSLGGGLRATRHAIREGNLQGIGEAGRHYSDTHLPGSSFLGRTGAGISRALGLSTLYEFGGRNDNVVRYNGRTMTIDQLNNLRSENDAIMQRRNAIRDAAVDAITADDSNIQMDVAGLGHGSYQQLLHQLEGMRSARGANETDAAYQARLQHINDLESALVTQRNEMRDAIVQYATSHGGKLGTLNNTNHVVWTDAKGGNHDIVFNTIDHSDDVISGRDTGIINTNYRSLGEMKVTVNSNDELQAVNTNAQNIVNDIDVVLQGNQQKIYRREDGTTARSRRASQESVDNRRNQSTNTSSNSNNGGH